MAAASLPVEDTHCVICDRPTSTCPEATAFDWEYRTTPQAFHLVRCLACGHVFLNPRPVSETAEVLYGRTYYTQATGHRAGSLGFVKEQVLAARLRSTTGRLPHGAAVLDVGCGDGALAMMLKRARADLRVTGLDVAFSDAHMATMRDAGVTCIAGAIEATVLPESTFELIVMNQVVEHLWDVRGVLRSLARALTPTGRLSLSTPNIDGYDRRWFRTATWGGYYVPRHLNLFSPATLTRLLQACGFGTVEVVPLTAPLIWVRNLQYAMASHRVPGAGFWVDANLAALALFAGLDSLAIRVGLSTSNMQLVAGREAGRTA